ncbi:Ig-like domain-containing protein [Sinimarinibacterium sp. NLF-5-8]|uniref:Ig-like domain-containing protein n=1 Tax=Sinimarinibacterium sp. NLF-5-8 TaxID=2698684 RepID=UPI00137C32BD|nr:Ig-like domain-containing protein [Sinimarinibacterium sp. NLF-5-8]QHS10151.1 Ig-like domain-containing protein [Sinimarinibacterium sp. NLF-5-8]
MANQTVIATVVNLSGQAWARQPDGSLRALKVGDSLMANEVLITADSAKIVLDFGDAREVVIDGARVLEPQALNMTLGAVNPEGMPELRSTPASADAEAQAPVLSLDGEGYNFVELVRVQEIVEADGITPLTLARVRELIRPLSMLLPDRDESGLAPRGDLTSMILRPGGVNGGQGGGNGSGGSVLPRPDETLRPDEQQRPDEGRPRPPSAGEDGNNAPAPQSPPTLTITIGADGTVEFQFSRPPQGFDGSDVVVENGRIENLRPDPNDPSRWIADLIPDANFEGTVTVTVDDGRYTDSRGQHGSGDSDSIEVDPLPPQARISIDPITGDDLISMAEAGGNVTVTGSTGGDVRPGDRVTVSVGGQTFTTTVDADGNWQVQIPGSVLANDQNLHASVTTQDSAGNSTTAEAGRPYTVDTDVPSLRVHNENPAVNRDFDGIYGHIVDTQDVFNTGGTVYLTVAFKDDDGNSVSALAGGTLVAAGHTVSAVTLADGEVPGVPAGTYYAVQGVQMGEQLKLGYTPPDDNGQPQAFPIGRFVIDSWAQHQEENADNLVTSHGQTEIAVQISNDGVLIQTQPSLGSETRVAGNAGLTEITGLTVSLNDNDGSESISAILLSNLPVGFLVFTGATAQAATQAEQSNNAGGDGSTNTWIISDSNGSLPAYIGILPPAHWSGTLSDLQVIVESGETTLDEKRVDTAQLADVTIAPVADGVTLNATPSFGRENQIIRLNLNATMVDPVQASATDSSTETTTLTLSGLGEHAALYLGTTLISGTSRVVDHGGGSYTISGLSQAELDQLGFMQARDALVDQDGAAGVQIRVEAFTVESGGGQSAPVGGFATVNSSAQLATSGSDTLLYTGQPINALGGDDTIQLRFGEDVSGADLAANLKNVETLDLGIAGENQIHNLGLDDVAAITDARGTLTIQGDGADTVQLNNLLSHDFGVWQQDGSGQWVSSAGGLALNVTGATVTDTPTDTATTKGGDSFSGDELQALLTGSGISKIDLSANGADTIDALTAEDVFGIVGNGGTLTIDGAGDDVVRLLDGEGWTWDADDPVGSHVVYTGTAVDDPLQTVTLQILSTVQINA